MKLTHFLFFVFIIVAASCAKKIDPRPAPVIIGREGDTCRISRISFWDRIIKYDYTANKITKITVSLNGFDYPHDLHYDLNGKLEKVSGRQVDTSYEYDSQGRLVKENRTLHDEGVITAIPHYESRSFEYNEKDQMVKCSYVEGRGTIYNSFLIKKGEIYLYETYTYDIQGSVVKMESYEMKPRSTTFEKTSEYIYSYDKMINPFYGHPGIYDYGMYAGNDIGNSVICFSQHNIVKEAANTDIQTAAFVYSLTKYPLSGKNVQLQQTSADKLTFEYSNCK